VVTGAIITMLPSPTIKLQHNCLYVWWALVYMANHMKQLLVLPADQQLLCFSVTCLTPAYGTSLKLV
jgi:hypothetical protein